MRRRLKGVLASATPASFAVVILCFAMPFVEISCVGEPVATFTGLDCAVGAPVENAHTFRSPVAAAALGAAVVGCVLSLLGNKVARGAACLAAVVAAAALFFFRYDVGGRLTGDIVTIKGKEALGAEFLYGYWLAFTTALMAAVLAALAAFAGGLKEER